MSADEDSTSSPDDDPYDDTDILNSAGTDEVTAHLAAAGESKTIALHQQGMMFNRCNTQVWTAGGADVLYINTEQMFLDCACVDSVKSYTYKHQSSQIILSYSDYQQLCHFCLACFVVHRGLLVFVSGPVGMAAAAAVATGKKRKRPHIFESNPSIRKRQQTRLLRWDFLNLFIFTKKVPAVFYYY